MLCSIRLKRVRFVPVGLFPCMFLTFTQNINMMKNAFLTVLMTSLALVAHAQVNLTDATFNTAILSTDKLVVVDFYADWCGPCRRMHPIVESLAKEYADQVIIGRLNVDYNMTSAWLGVSSLPTFLFIKNRVVVYEVKGVISKEILRQLIDYYR